MFVVYVHEFPNGKRYVGITSQKVNRRWRNGKAYSSNIRMTNAINKYGWTEIKHTILYTGLTMEEAEETEKRLISEWDLTNPERGYNIAEGGCHPLHSEETKRKIGLASIGRTHSEEFKQMIHEKNSGAGNYMFGKHHSEETKRKISESKKASNAPGPNKGKFGSANPNAKRIACIDTTTNEIVKEFDSIVEACQKINRSKSCLDGALHGVQKTCAGYRWVYL